MQLILLELNFYVTVTGSRNGHPYLDLFYPKFQELGVAMKPGKEIIDAEVSE